MFQQPHDSLIIMNAAVHKTHGDVLVKHIQHKGLKKPGNTGRGCHGVSQSDLLVVGRCIFIIHAPQAVITVNLSVDGHRWLSHPGSGKLPIMTGVECRGVKNEYRNLRGPAPIVMLGGKTFILTFRLDKKIIQPAGLMALAIFDPRVYFFFIQFTRLLGTGVIGQENHFQVGGKLGSDPGPNVALHTGQKLFRNSLDNFNVVIPADLVILLIFKELAQF